MIEIKYDEKGLVPAIVQDYYSKKVLMLAYMNEESLQKTLETGETWFFSRSRQELWNKGATSGNRQHIMRISYDCDQDAILAEVKQDGAACHTGNLSCFYRELDNRIGGQAAAPEIIENLVKIIRDRKENPKEGSYTNYLFEKGIDKVLKKVGEESAEVIIASKNTDKSELIYEICDLIYHTLVLMEIRDVSVEELRIELGRRYQ